MVKRSKSRKTKHSKVKRSKSRKTKHSKVKRSKSRKVKRPKSRKVKRLKYMKGGGFNRECYQYRYNTKDKGEFKIMVYPNSKTTTPNTPESYCIPERVYNKFKTLYINKKSDNRNNSSNDETNTLDIYNRKFELKSPTYYKYDYVNEYEDSYILYIWSEIVEGSNDIEIDAYNEL
jgi:hypothetical protein